MTNNDFEQKYSYPVIKFHLRQTRAHRWAPGPHLLSSRFMINFTYMQNFCPAFFVVFFFAIHLPSEPKILMPPLPLSSTKHNTFSCTKYDVPTSEINSNFLSCRYSTYKVFIILPMLMPNNLLTSTHKKNNVDHALI